MISAEEVNVPVFRVTAGATVATCTAGPLLTLFVETTAVRVSPPVKVPSALNETVSDVALAVVGVTVAVFPETVSFNRTESCEAVALKPIPVIVSVVKDVVALFCVTTGEIVATCTAAPLLTPLEVTTAVNGSPPVSVPMPLNETVSDVVVTVVGLAVIDFPLTVSFTTTEFNVTVGPKFVPLIVSVVALAASEAVL
jgi:hypothetical protein